MKTREFVLPLERNSAITMNVIPGHFTTKKAHISHYLDVSRMKSNAMMAKEVAHQLAVPYLANTSVDTIVCMENTKVIGAYLADELLSGGVNVMNEGGDIHIVTPMSNKDGSYTFYDSELEWIGNKHVLLLFATIASGRTARKAVECVQYYGGWLAGISALFLSSEENFPYHINPLFTADDIEGYKVYKLSECELCHQGKPIEALISSEGYTKI